MAKLDFFRKSPAFADQEFSELAVMLCHDVQNPTCNREFLDEKQLDFSIESLKHIDAYLAVLHAKPPQDKSDTARVVLRCGAYVGEVIRRNSGEKIHWVTFQEAAKFSTVTKGLGYSIATAGILWRDAENISFPLAKVGKFLENGSEDSVYFFSKVIVSGIV